MTKIRHQSALANFRLIQRCGIAESIFYGVVDRPAWSAIRAQLLRRGAAADASVTRMDLSLMVVGGDLPAEGVNARMRPGALIVLPEYYDAAVVYAREMSALYGATRVIFLPSQIDRAYRWAETMAERPRH